LRCVATLGVDAPSGAVHWDANAGAARSASTCPKKGKNSVSDAANAYRLDMDALSYLQTAFLIQAPPSLQRLRERD